jgi:hypothetical protein
MLLWKFLLVLLCCQCLVNRYVLMGSNPGVLTLGMRFICCICLPFLLVLVQARSLQRMASSVFARGISSALGSRSPSVRCASSRPVSSGGHMTGAAAAHGRRAGARLAAHPLGDISDTGNGLEEGLCEGQEPHGGDLSPMTPARPSGMFGGDDLGELLPVSAGLACSSSGLLMSAGGTACNNRLHTACPGGKLHAREQQTRCYTEGRLSEALGFAC